MSKFITEKIYEGNRKVAPISWKFGYLIIPRVPLKSESQLLMNDL